MALIIDFKGFFKKSFTRLTPMLEEAIALLLITY